MTFPERLEMLLKERHITAKQLQERLGLGSTTITDWKRGKSSPSPETLIGISRELGVSIDFLLTGEQKELPVEGQLKAYNALDEEVSLSEEIQQLARFRANRALTQRIKEVAREVMNEEDRHSSD
jgi:transcriptional regulator with XRE-family HTH domain